jgi:hypothetical protein
MATTISSGRATFRKDMDPHMIGNDPVWAHLRPVTDSVSGSRMSIAVSRGSISEMRNKTEEATRVRP